ncbi:MAG TPA: hypothetical protein VGS22_21850 [Thermoanaerobaculia bacterium]|jgi:hypothetical protein|nr:hypothetical protein [Thermoanaerobaculia bacterium]
MRSKLSRHLVPATLAAAILIAPLPASAAPREFGWEAVVGWANGLLRHLWAEEGASFDPLGRPEVVSARTPQHVRQIWAQEGASCDPLGRPAACASGMTLEDRRQ